jgi:hypothetical protein
LSHPKISFKVATATREASMALIEKKLVTERETASYKLDCSTVALVRLYAEFIGSPQEHVVNEALVYIFGKDKDFNEWLKANGKLDLVAAHLTPESSVQRTHRAPVHKASTSAVANGNKS